MGENMKVKKRQKLDQITGGTLIAGIDIGKRKHYLRFIDQRGYELGKVFSFKNNRDGLDKAVDMIEKIKKDNNLKKAVIGIEPSGQYWKAAAYYFQDRGYPLALVNPYHVKKIKELEDNSQTKTDIKDCILVARLVKDGNYFNPNLAHGIYAELQRLSRLRLKVKKSYIREKTKLRTLLDEYFPEYEGLFCDLLGASSTHILKNYFLPETLADTNLIELTKNLSVVSRGKIKADKVVRLVDLAKSSIGIKSATDTAILEKEYIMDSIEDLKEKLSEITSRIKKCLSSIEHSQYLLSIPGVGPVTAAGFLGEVGDILKYRSSKEIIKLAGLNLVEISSGIKKGKKKISKRGNSFLRLYLYQCAVVAIAKNSQLKRYFLEHTKTKNKMKILVAVQCKLARIMFALLKHKRYYDPKEVEKHIFAEAAA
jgi:transposase